MTKVFSAIAMFFASVAVGLVMFSFFDKAYAADTPPAVAALDITAIIAMIVGVMVGASVLIHAVAVLIRTVVTATKTKADDAALLPIADKLDHAHERIDDVVADVKNILSVLPSAKPAVALVPPVVLALLFLSGCATVRPVAAEAVTAELDCSAPAMIDVVKSIGSAAEVYLASKISGDGRSVDTTTIKADLKALGSKAWSCALSVALNVVLGKTSIAHAVGPKPPWGSVLLEVKSGLGVDRIKLPDGSVL